MSKRKAAVIQSDDEHHEYGLMDCTCKTRGEHMGSLCKLSRMALDVAAALVCLERSYKRRYIDEPQAEIDKLAKSKKKQLVDYSADEDEGDDDDEVSEEVSPDLR